MKKAGLITFILLLLTATPTTGLVRAANTLPVIRILPDGGITPSDAPIQRNGDIYTFTGNIYARIVVDRDNLVIDGAGYTLHGNYNGTRTDSWVVGQGPDQEYGGTPIPWSIGIDLANKNRYNLTIRNLNIKNFYIGIYVWTTNNTITNCAVTDNIVGILLSGNSNNITRNYIARNEQGIFFGVNQPRKVPINIVIAHNSFIGNLVQLSGCVCEDYNTSEPVHTWDNGREGNYWSDYNGTDANGDGIGDTPYIIDVQNQDRYPLMQGIATLPSPKPNIPIETVIVTILTLTVVAIVVIVANRYRMKKKQKNNV